MHKGVTWQAQHLTCPFGAKASVTAWHRVSSLLKHDMIQSTGSVIGRYVDDFFGVDLPGLYWSTTRMFNILCELVGCPCDPGKAASSMTELSLLGANIRINYDQWAYFHRIMPEKAAKWSAELMYSRGQVSYNLGVRPRSSAN